MATVIICVVLAVLFAYSIFSYTKKLSKGCCGGEADTVEKIKPKDKDPAEYPYKYRLKIGGMTCKNCAVRLENAFNREEVFRASVNFKKKEAEVLAEQETPQEAFRMIVARTGYVFEGCEQIKPA